MSSNRDDVLILEYIALIRQIMSHHHSLIESYSHTTSTICNTMSMILRDSINRNNTNYRNNSANDSPNQPTRPNPPNQPTLWNMWGMDNNTNTTNRRNTWQFPTTNTRNPVVRTYTPQSLRRFRYRDNTFRPTRISRRRRQNLVQQILNNTLYTSTTRQPASNRDISRNTTIVHWEDISSSTDQTICPITQENFLNGDRLMRINNCGHLFSHDALFTYFTEFDHRCPICRYNIQTSINPPSRTINNTTNTHTSNSISRPTSNSTSTHSSTSTHTSTSTSNFFDNSFNNIFSNPPNNLTRGNSFWDVSLNFNPFPNSTDIPSTDNFSFNDAINQISNAMASEITNAINNTTDNSGNVISAEYSVFIPSVNTNFET